MSSSGQASMSTLSSGGGGGRASIRSLETASGRSFSTVDPHPSTAKKKRNLPGNPDPSAEVIALSPGTLMATNRFTCEICNKGFQREQNLQLHRRGHNLPWKLRQRMAGAEARKRVYVCPEPSCVHHNPARALGDLTGIKKHYCRKHGEKKWRCERCSKRYAVKSDWKAHMKTCGTKEYRCDCGSVFSRRDSLITHRAFCNALTEESHKILYENDQTTLVSPPPPPPPLPPSQPHHNHHLPATITPNHPPPLATSFLHSNDLRPFPTTCTCEPNPHLLPTTQHLNLSSSPTLLEKMAQADATATADHHHHPYGGGGSELDKMVWAHQRGGDVTMVDFMGVAEKRRRHQRWMAPPLHPFDM